MRNGYVSFQIHLALFLIHLPGSNVSVSEPKVSQKHSEVSSKWKKDWLFRISWEPKVPPPRPRLPPKKYWGGSFGRGTLDSHEDSLTRLGFAFSMLGTKFQNYSPFHAGFLMGIYHGRIGKRSPLTQPKDQEIKVWTLLIFPTNM